MQLQNETGNHIIYHNRHKSLIWQTDRIRRYISRHSSSDFRIHNHEEGDGRGSRLAISCQKKNHPVSSCTTKSSCKCLHNISPATSFHSGTKLGTLHFSSHLSQTKYHKETPPTIDKNSIWSFLLYGFILLDLHWSPI